MALQRRPTRLRRPWAASRSEEHTSELQSLTNIVCRLLLEKKNSALLAISIECGRTATTADPSISPRGSGSEAFSPKRTTYLATLSRVHEQVCIKLQTQMRC